MTPAGDRIHVFTGTTRGESNNIYGHVEMGVKAMGNKVYSPDKDAPSPPDAVFEILLWQRYSPESYDNANLGFNDTIGPVVEDVGQPFAKIANRTFVWNETFYQVRKSATSDIVNIMNHLDHRPGFQVVPGEIISLASPIGIRCHVTSTLGTAQLDPNQSVFRSFTPTPNPPMNGTTMEYPTPRFGKVIEDILLGKHLQIFESVNARAPRMWSNPVEYRSFIQPEMLLKSVMLAYGHDALQIIYEHFGFENPWKNENLTSSTAGKLLTPGVVAPIAPAIVLAIWAVSCMVLGLWYEFRPRWADSLNGYEFFRFGVGIANDIKNEADYAGARDFQHVGVLATLPGSVRGM